MNCLEFRRRLSADPEDRDAAIRAHTRDCASCSHWAAEAKRFESLLHQAMEVEVPENLESRILLRLALRYPQREATSRRGFALAASILGAVLLGGALLWFESKPTLANDVFAHMDEMPYSLTSTTILEDE